jgi:hypothetical protein
MCDLQNILTRAAPMHRGTASLISSAMSARAYLKLYYNNSKAAGILFS